MGAILNLPTDLPRWTKVTVPYTAVSTGALTNAKSIFTLPIKGVVHGAYAKVNTPFLGTSITSVNLSVGISGNTAKYIPNTPADKNGVVSTDFAPSPRKVDVWVFPDNTIDPTSDITSNQFYAIKPIWYQVESNGTITLRNNSSFGSNFFYTTNNAALVKAHSTEQYVNVSCGAAASMDALCSSSGNRSTAVTALVSFCSTNGFTGVELDFEDFASWSSGQYTNFKTFVNQLGIALHAAGYKLMIDVPSIWNSATVSSAFEWTARNSTGYYQLKYEDFAALPVDYIVPMAYDYQFDLGAGYPNSPLQYAADVASWAWLKMGGKDRVIIGLPSAGYSGTTGGFSPTGHTFAVLSAATGYGKYTRDALSGELIWDNAGTSYAACDDIAMDIKTRFVEKYGCERFSLWHAGNNKYGTIPTMSIDTMGPESTTATTTVSANFTAVGANLSSLTQGSVDIYLLTSQIP